MEMLLEVFKLFAIDALFVGVLVLLIVPLFTYRKAAYAVLERNFVGYFMNPTGYVFLCLFVLLTSFAAFWPHEFFTANLANLDQLNKYLPHIMLIFIPAITMGVWAEERRQGTDELLLTLPADDFDIVFGKYLAAAMIFTASLLFSQLSNFIVLVALTAADLDLGLFFTTYFGYWLVGLAMLAIGMIASFLTSNLTVGFILGVAFNAPLAFAVSADVIIPRLSLARTVAHWSISEQFDDFGRGVLSLSSTTYFIMLIVVGLYLCMVLIGKRHWSGGRDGHAMLGHYLVRGIALIVVVLGANVVFSNYDFIRKDATVGQVSALSEDTRRLIRELETEHPITIDAFISGEVPESYVQTKFDLISKLKEFRSLAGGKITVHIHDGLETFSEDTALAEERFGITPQRRPIRTRGAFAEQDILIGAAFTCGLEKVVVPFFDYGIPVEYELVRSIATVARGGRNKLGLVRTDAQLNGGFSFAGGMPRQLPKFQIITELEKQYDVEDVDPGEPIPVGKYDVLMVVQPSSMAPNGLANLIDAIRAGVPTAIFEDPMPWILRNVPATGAEKQAPGGGMGGMMGGRGGPVPKGDISQLWELLEIDVPNNRSTNMNATLYEPDIAWQQYNPYPKLEHFPPEFVFVRNESPGGEDSLNPGNIITSGLAEVLLPAAGTLKPKSSETLEFEPLLTTGSQAGTNTFQDFQDSQRAGSMVDRVLSQKRLILAAHITGKDSGETTEPDESSEPAESDTPEETDEDEESTDRPINVVYVSDIDLFIDDFMVIRARPEDSGEVEFHFDNVSFILNTIDTLSGDDEYIPIRNRKPRHYTLKLVGLKTADARKGETQEVEKFKKEFQEKYEAAEAENKKAIEEFQKKLNELREKRRTEGGGIGEVNHAAQTFQEKQQVLQQKLEKSREQLERQRDTNIKKIQRKKDLEVLQIQNWFKFWAVVLPPIPPLLVGLVVFVRRRLREREGVTKTRLR